MKKIIRPARSCPRCVRGWRQTGLPLQKYRKRHGLWYLLDKGKRIAHAENTHRCTWRVPSWAGCRTDETREIRSYGFYAGTTWEYKCWRHQEHRNHKSISRWERSKGPSPYCHTLWEISCISLYERPSRDGFRQRQILEQRNQKKFIFLWWVVTKFA